MRDRTRAHQYFAACMRIDSFAAVAHQVMHADGTLACMRLLHPERTDMLAQLRGMFAGEFV